MRNMSVRHFWAQFYWDQFATTEIICVLEDAKKNLPITNTAKTLKRAFRSLNSSQITLIIGVSQIYWTANRTINLSGWQHIFHSRFSSQRDRATWTCCSKWPCCYSTLNSMKWYFPWNGWLFFIKNASSFFNN